MADAIPYPQYHLHQQQQYYPPHPQVHPVSQPRQDPPPQRKRPKYTRSKTGCMTCRIKKIKCDESKPNCLRCSHGQRDCTWPDGAPARKKPLVKKEPSDSVSTGSPISDVSTPSVRDISPTEVGLPPLVSRRNTEPYLHLHPVAHPDLRHQSSHSHSPPLASPDLSYPQTRYEYSSEAFERSAPLDGGRHHPQWQAHPMLASNNLDPYHYHVQDRSLMGHVPETHRYHQ